MNVVYLGTIPYERALKIQYELLDMRQNGVIDDTLLLLEHPPVLTLGTRGNYSNIYLSSAELKKQGIDIFEVNRGGDVTYHGPGQIVGYPIFNINDMGIDIRTFVNNLEQSIIKLLYKEYNIESYRQQDKFTGVWVNDCKIAALGISIKKWVSMHGFAFNVNTNLEHFNLINPCGLSKGVTSVEKLTGNMQDMDAVSRKVEQYIAEEFGCEFLRKDINSLI